MMRSTLLATSFLVLLGCGEPLDQFSLPVDTGVPPTDAGVEPEDAGPTDAAADAGNVSPQFTPVDMIVFVDSSGSMADEQENLALNFDRFLEQVAGTVDYRLAVVSTDLSSEILTGNVDIQYASTFPNQYTSFSRDGCEPSGVERGCFWGQPSVIDSALSRPEQLAAFQTSVKVGTCGSGDESGLEAMRLAFEQMAPGGCNEGFLRPDANLVLVFVSDEDDGSTLPVADFVSVVGQTKEWSKVRVATVVGAFAGQASACNVTDGSSCGSSVCDATPPGSGAFCGDSAQTCQSSEVCGASAACVDPTWGAYTPEVCGWCSFFNAADCCSALGGDRFIAFARAVESEVVAAAPRIPRSGCVGLGTHVACLAETICQESFGDTMARIALELVRYEEPRL